MGFFDSRMINQETPDSWKKYHIHVEVNINDALLIEHLEKTKWEYFADGGAVTSDGMQMNFDLSTRWYGLNKNDLLINF